MDSPPSPARVLRRPAFWWTAWALWFVALFVLSSLSGHRVENPPLQVSDKILHAAYFAAGAAVFYAALATAPAGFRSNIFLFLACLSMAAAVGAFDEWHQTFTEGRSGNDAGDLLADIAGGAIGWGAAAFCRRWLAGRARLARGGESVRLPAQSQDG